LPLKLELRRRSNLFELEIHSLEAPIKEQWKKKKKMEDKGREERDVGRGTKMSEEKETRRWRVWYTHLLPLLSFLASTFALTCTRARAHMHTQLTYLTSLGNFPFFISFFPFL